MVKTKFKKAVSLMLAAVMSLTAFMGIGATTAFAAVGEKADVYLVDYPRSGDTNNNGEWGHGNLNYMNGWKGLSTKYTGLRAMGSYSGNIAYCIEPGTGQRTGDTLTEKDENFFNNISPNGTISGDDIRLLIGRILQYGYRGGISTSWKSQNESDANCIAHAYATQILIWETIVGERDASFNHVSTGGYNAVLECVSSAHPLRSKILSYYNSMVTSVQNHTKVPSFCTRSSGSANIKREFSPEQYQALADVIAYAKDEEKTEREFYVEGINCNVAIARDQFITVKEQYQKTDGIQAYHGYLSFKETDISPEMAQKIGMEFANEVWGKRFQVVVTTHLNTKHLHCHFVINSISFVDGKHLWGEEKAWFKFRKVADRICEKYGLYYDPNPNRSKQSEYLTMKEKAGMPTRYSVAKEAIDYAIDHSKTLKEFQFALKEMGYVYNLSPSRKYWTVIPKGYDKPIRLKNLGADYTNDRIVERIKENRDRWAEIEPFQRATYKPRQYRMQTRGQKLKKKGGLYGLYLYYCYRLGYLPKYKKQNNARLHYLLKDDLMKLDKITDEVRLLGRENISTDEQLFSYKTSLEEQMKNLIAGRTHLRKKIRTNIDDGQLQAAKDEIASINGELKKLRREVKLCEYIAERSKVMEENLEHIETEEQKQQRKEKSRYEQRW